MKIDIVFSADEQFIPFMGVAMTSILMNASETDEISFHVVSRFISEESRQRIFSLRKIREFELDVPSVDPDILSDISLISSVANNTFISEAAYFRLMVGRIFPGLDKILYLDCDLIVRKSLRALWDTDLSCHTIAVVRQSVSNRMIEPLLGIPEYFNSGVILFNLDRWRSLNYGDKCLQVEKQLLALSKYHDQSILNLLFRKGDAKYLSAKYNFMPNFIKGSEYMNLPSSIKDDPVIIHFAGAKPWNLDGFLGRKHFPYSRYYWEHQQNSPWDKESSIGKIRPSDVVRYLGRHPKDTAFALKRLRRLKSSGHY